MSDIPGAVGAAVEGAALARAVEPKAGEKLDHGHFAEQSCLNCGAQLTGPFCSECGQHAHLHRTFGAFLHDFSHSVLHLDGKIWHTLPLLALKPGKLTRRYIEGERARFVSPMALFLFTVFLIFALFIALGVSPPAEIKPDLTVDQSAEAVVSGLQQHESDLKEQLEKLPAGDPGRADIEEEIATTEQTIKNASDFKVNLAKGVDFTVDKPHTGYAQLDAALVKWRKNPGLMLYKLQANSYKFSWLLIVISTPMVWLIFAWRRRFGLYDHAVFVTYSIAFMSLFFVAVALLGLVGVPGAVLVPVALLVPLLHLYKHVKYAYELSRFSAIWRTGALVAFIALAILLFALALVMLGTLG